MTEQQPITLPPELVQQWVTESWHVQPRELRVAASDIHIATQSARWGADHELEACCAWLDQSCGRWDLLAGLRAARRPKPPSLKEQALDRCNDYIDPDGIIRRALEQLDD